MRLIDADHLRKWIIANWHSGWHHKTVDDILDQIDREDTYFKDADIVDAKPIILSVKNGRFEAKEIVFCKDCKWWVQEDDEYGYCKVLGLHGFNKDDFCSNGKRNWFLCEEN